MNLLIDHRGTHNPSQYHTMWEPCALIHPFMLQCLTEKSNPVSATFDNPKYTAQQCHIHTV
uniref:Uncharacterized protein n=1 Tax=Rhizophora mucronata TaxID=61149 RepID=A0A2P2JVE3_RHIMU